MTKVLRPREVIGSRSGVMMPFIPWERLTFHPSSKFVTQTLLFKRTVEPFM